MLIDSHCHLMKFHQRGDLPEILREAEDMGVGHMIAIGTDKDDWAINLELAQLYTFTIDPSVVVYVTYDGLVAESYPVQGGAKTIFIEN